MAQGRYDQAVVFLEQAVVAKPKDAKILESLFHCCLKTGDYSRAVELTGRLAQLNPSARLRLQWEAKALQQLREGRSALARRETEAAAKLYRAAARQQTYHPEVTWEAGLLLGDLCFEGKDYAGAAQAYGDALSVGCKSFSAETLYRYLFALVQTAETMKAVATLDEHKAKVPKQDAERFDALLADAYAEIVGDMLRQRQHDKASLLMGRELLLKGLERMMAEGPARQRVQAKLVEVKHRLATLLIREGDAALAQNDTRAASIAYDDAVRLCEGIQRPLWSEAGNKLYRLNCDAERRYFEGWALYCKKQWKEAIAVFDDVLRRYPRGKPAKDSLFEKAFAYKHLGKPELAAQHFKELIATYPDSSGVPWACFEIAEYHTVQKEAHEEAIKWLRQAVERMPQGHNTDLCQYYIATTYWELMGNYKAAYAELKKFLDLYPKSDLRRRVELRIEYIERNHLENVENGPKKKPTVAKKTQQTS